MVLIEFNVKWLVTCNNVSKLVSLQDCSDLKQDKLGNTHFNSKKKKKSAYVCRDLLAHIGYLSSSI